MKLKCEVRLKGICEGTVEVTKQRPIYICRPCIEKLRKKGSGPVQLLRRKEVKGLILSIIRKGL